MCASYGLDPRFTDAELLADSDADIIDGLREWSRRNAGETLRPTGRNRRNLNPIVIDDEGADTLIDAWWGYLVGGAPARFPSINTRSERLRQRPGDAARRAIVPTTGWFEMSRPERVWHEFGLEGGPLFGMAAVTRPGRTAEGEPVVCYSIVMRPAPERLADLHDRVPVLIPTDFARDWLAAEPGIDVIDAALSSAASLDDRIRAVPRATDSDATGDAPERLF